MGQSNIYSNINRSSNSSSSGDRVMVTVHGYDNNILKFLCGLFILPQRWFNRMFAPTMLSTTSQWCCRTAGECLPQCLLICFP